MRAPQWATWRAVTRTGPWRGPRLRVSQIGSPDGSCYPSLAALLRLAGLVSPGARQIPEILYQFDRPFVLDSTAAQKAFNLTPAPTDQALGETIRAMKATA